MTPRPRKKKPEEIGPSPPVPMPLTPEDWEEVEHGIGLFNSGKFWHAHEAWELVWQRQDADERLFFQGLIQAAAAYHHLVTGKSRAGYVNNLRKARRILEVFAPEYIGVCVTPLLQAIDAGLAEAGSSMDDGEEGAEATTGGDAAAEPSRKELSLIPRITFHLPFHPDLVVAVRSATANPLFAEGVDLFNDGYHWEAHERWEEVRREAEGEAKNFIQGFVQAAAGLTFLKARKTDSAGYLFLKSLELLRPFEEMNSGVEVRSLVGWIAGLLHANGTGVPGVKGHGADVPRLVLTEKAGGRN